MHMSPNGSVAQISDPLGCSLARGRNSFYFFLILERKGQRNQFLVPLIHASLVDAGMCPA